MAARPPGASDNPLPPPPPAPNIFTAPNGEQYSDQNGPFPVDEGGDHVMPGPNTIHTHYDDERPEQWDNHEQYSDTQYYNQEYEAAPLKHGPICLPPDPVLSASLITTSLANISSFFLTHFTPTAFMDTSSYDKTLAPIQASIETLVATWNRSTGDAAASPRSQSAHDRNTPPTRGQAAPQPRSQPTTYTDRQAEPSRSAPAARPGASRSFAQAAATQQPSRSKGKGRPGAQSSPLDTVRGLAAAFPSATMHEVTNMASKIIEPAGPVHKKPAIRHAPKGANKAITISFTGSFLPNASTIPADGVLLKKLSAYLANHDPENFGGDNPAIRVERTQWLPNVGFRVSFSERPPENLDDALHSYLARYTDEDCRHLRVSRFQFRNTVFFRRVPMVASNGVPSTVNGLLNELLADPLWRNIPLAGTPRLHVPEHSPGYGILYVDFIDNARSSVLRNALKQSVYLGDDLCRPLQATNPRPAAPRCMMCQKWGHRAFQCRSPSVRCGHCGGMHDERRHVDVADCCREAPPADRVCRHPPSCVNCQEGHRSDAKTCAFFTHRADAAWLRAHQPNPPTHSAARSRTTANTSASRSQGPRPSQTPGASSSRSRTMN